MCSVGEAPGTCLGTPALNQHYFIQNKSFCIILTANINRSKYYLTFSYHHQTFQISQMCYYTRIFVKNVQHSCYLQADLSAAVWTADSVSVGTVLGVRRWRKRSAPAQRVSETVLPQTFPPNSERQDLLLHHYTISLAFYSDRQREQVLFLGMQQFFCQNVCMLNWHTWTG